MAKKDSGKISESFSKSDLEKFLLDGIEYVNIDTVEYFSTGNLVLDALLGRGWSRGRIHLLKGRESVSKSRLMASVCFVETVFYKNYVLVIDYEGTWTNEWLRKLYIDVDKVMIIRPDTAEASFDIVTKAIVSGKISSIIIDSIASMSTIEESEKSHEESTQASLARQLSKFCRKSVSTLNKIRLENLKNNSNLIPTIFLINQVRTNLHAKFNTEVLPGGQMQRNTATTILDLFRTSNIEDSEGENVGFFIHAKTDKNKVGVPFRSTTFGLITNEKGFLGHPQHSFFHGNDLFNLGLNFGIIERTGAWYNIPDFGKFQGEYKTIQEIISNKKISEHLLNSIKKRIKQETGNEIEFNFEILKKSLGQ